MNFFLRGKNTHVAALLCQFRWMAILCMLAGISISTCDQTLAQMPQDVRDVFEGMLDSLDDDIQDRFRIAIANDTTQVEFTPQEFKRFRASSANPFEGLDKIRIGKRKSNIVLNFELPSMRNRKIKASERQSASVLNGLYASVSPAASSTVKIFSKDRQVAMGSVVKSDGYVLTKLSEVENRDNVRVRLSDGSEHSATVFKTNSENDLAILKIAVADLPVVKWADVQPKLGAFLLTPSTHGKPLAIGSYSVRPRSTREGEQAFLGVQPIVTEYGVRVEEIQPGTASYAAGLKNGDVIINLGGHQIVDVSSLVKAIRGHRPGDKVEIEYRRKGVSQTTTATLAGAGIGGERAARFKMMNRLGAVPSRRDGNFPNVFQHDTPLFPEQCGGPIVDLDGQVVGLNIARKGRAASFALPSSYVRTLVDEMIRTDVASDSENANTK